MHCATKCFNVLSEMNAMPREKLAAPRNYRLRKTQVNALGFLSDVNDALPVQHFVRTFVDFGLKLTRMNGNQIPLMDQVRLQRALLSRANRDAKRKK